MRVDSHTQIWQAMRVLIHTHISCRLLAPKPLLNTEFHSVAARSANALKEYAKMPTPLAGMEQIVPPLIVLRATVKQRSP